MEEASRWGANGGDHDNSLRFHMLSFVILQPVKGYPGEGHLGRPTTTLKWSDSLQYVGQLPRFAGGD